MRQSLGRHRLWQRVCRVRQAKVRREVETAALAGFTLYPDAAAHHAHQLARDCQPETGAAVVARRRYIRLREGIKDHHLLVAGDADTRIGDGEVQTDASVAGCLLRGAVVIRLIDGDLHKDLTFMGELDGIAQQVHQHLLQAARVADDFPENLRVDAASQFQMFLVGTHGETAGGPGDCGVQIEG